MRTGGSSDHLDRYDVTRGATRFGLIGPDGRASRAHGPAAHGPHGMMLSAAVRNNARSGQLEGKCMRMRAACSITRAPILIRRSRIVANSALASELVFGMAGGRP